MRTLKAALALALTVAFVAVAPSPAASSPSPGVHVVLSYASAQHPNQVQTTTLTCHPVNEFGTAVLDPFAACADIDAAGGDFHALPGWWVSCGPHGASIRTTATGHWFGVPVDYDEVHDNICEVRRATGWVFLF